MDVPVERPRRLRVGWTTHRRATPEQEYAGGRGCASGEVQGFGFASVGESRFGCREAAGGERSGTRRQDLGRSAPRPIHRCQGRQCFHPRSALARRRLRRSLLGSARAPMTSWTLAAAMAIRLSGVTSLVSFPAGGLRILKVSDRRRRSRTRQCSQLRSRRPSCGPATM